MYSEDHAAAIEGHYARLWGPPVRRQTPRDGPRHDLPSDFEVLVFQRNETTCYATRCMSQAGDDERLEIHLLADISSPFRPELVELLTSLAHFHRTGAFLGVGHSVDFGRPWIAGGTCSFGLVSLPYLDGPILEWMAEPRIRFLWLVPITAQEREFKKVHGTEALEQRLEASGFDYLDPVRNSIV